MTTNIIIASIFLLIFTLGFFRHKQKRNKVVQVVEDNCKGCQLCLRACRHDALATASNDSGRRIVVIDSDRCTTCMKCLKACKFNALELIDRSKARKRVY